MNRKEFENRLANLARLYIEDYDVYGINARLRINPVSLESSIITADAFQSEIACSTEAVEDAAAAHGMASQSATDYQVAQNPDFYSIDTLLITGDDGRMFPNEPAISHIAAIYFRK